MVLIVCVYAAIAVFIAGNVYRIIRVARMPAPLRWELYPIPRGPLARQRYGGSYFEESQWWTKPPERNVGSELWLIAQEVLLQKTVWRNHRALWPWTWLLHAGIYGLAATLVTAAMSAGLAHSGFAAERFFENCATTLPWISMPAGLLGAVGLLLMRLFSARLSPYSSRAVLFNLVLLGTIFGTGAAVLLVPGGSTQMVDFVAALFGLRIVPPMNVAAQAHLAVSAVFLAYFPFTQMTHAYMKFFAFHRVRWDDTPARRDDRIQSEIQANLGRPLTWSAPHIRSTGQSWAAATANTEHGSHA